jgi:uncharacterized zinc-type alcohol dehydrogenase-like protein
MTVDVPARAFARCVPVPSAPLAATEIALRALGPMDVRIDVAFCGLCHTDIDHARNVRGTTRFPLVPGHELSGRVASIGARVTRFKVGDAVGVGNIVDSCRDCRQCAEGLEQYCRQRVLTYGQIGRDGRITNGGYSTGMVVDQAYLVRIPPEIPLDEAAPLLCAGITVYSPFKHWKVGPGTRVAIIGLGGLGHLGVQIARALGAPTTVVERNPAKELDALRLGAEDFVLSNPGDLERLTDTFDLVISTVPSLLDVDPYLKLLDQDGVFVNLAAPPQPLAASAALLMENRRSMAGTRSGGIAETQEMIDFCAVHGVRPAIERIGPDEIDAAFARLEAGDVRYRFVVRCQEMKG